MSLACSTTTMGGKRRRFRITGRLWRSALIPPSCLKRWPGWPAACTRPDSQRTPPVEPAKLCALPLTRHLRDSCADFCDASSEPTAKRDCAGQTASKSRRCQRPRIRVAYGARRLREEGRNPLSDRSAVIHELACKIHALEFQHPTRVAIDGIDGAGKTWLADELVEPLGELGRPVIRASIDGFHRPRSERYRRGEASPEGYYRDSFDNAALTSILLEPLGPSGDRRFRTAIFDYRSDGSVRQRLQTADRCAVLLFDGVFLLRPELERFWDFKVFVKTSFASALERVTTRDAPMFGSRHATRDRYLARYQPGQRLYFAESMPEQSADVVIINDDLARPRLTCRRREIP